MKSPGRYRCDICGKSAPGVSPKGVSDISVNMIVQYPTGWYPTGWYLSQVYHDLDNLPYQVLVCSTRCEQLASFVIEVG